MKFRKRTRWLWLIPPLILFWIAGAVSEIREKLLLEKEGVLAMARIESPEWVASRGAKALVFDAEWTHGGREYRRAFKVPSTVGSHFVDPDGRQLVDRVEIRFAPSRPEVAVLSAFPGDPAWVGMILAGFGITAFSAVAGWLIVEGRRVK